MYTAHLIMVLLIVVSRIVQLESCTSTSVRVGAPVSSLRRTRVVEYRIFILVILPRYYRQSITVHSTYATTRYSAVYTMNSTSILVCIMPSIKRGSSSRGSPSTYQYGTSTFDTCIAVRTICSTSRLVLISLRIYASTESQLAFQLAAQRKFE